MIFDYTNPEEIPENIAKPLEFFLFDVLLFDPNKITVTFCKDLLSVKIDNSVIKLPKQLRKKLISSS